MKKVFEKDDKKIIVTKGYDHEENYSVIFKWNEFESYIGFKNRDELVDKFFDFISEENIFELVDSFKIDM